MAKQKILVVDDELDMRVFLQTLLETRGFKVLSAQDGREGLRLAREHKPALITLDMMMPKENGIQMYRELKSDPGLRDIPVVVVSALSSKTYFHSQKALDEYKGVDMPEPAAYIEKPPETDELIETIRRALKP